MKRKIICYDIHGGDSGSYNEVYSFIEKELSGTRATESVYICFSDKDNNDIRDIISKKFGEDVSVLVNDFPLGAAWYNLNDASKWKDL